jgi:hypothetical protein
MYTFTTPTVNNTPNHPGYFPLTIGPTTPINNQPVPPPNNNFAQTTQRPIMPRTSQQHQFATDNNRTDTLQIPSGADPIFSPMLETPPSNRESVVEAAANLIESKKQSTSNSSSSSSSHGGNGSGTSSRKMYNDLLSPVSRNSRVGITKQHYRKSSTNKEENLAKLHPLRILLAEDNICKSWKEGEWTIYVCSFFGFFFFFFSESKDCNKYFKATRLYGCGDCKQWKGGVVAHENMCI